MEKREERLAQAIYRKKPVPAEIGPRFTLLPAGGGDVGCMAYRSTAEGIAI